MSGLTELAALANEEHRLSKEAAASALAHGIAAGYALLHARDLVGEGQWILWLSENFAASKTAAYRYMRLAKYEDCLPEGDLSMRDAMKLLQGAKRINGQMGPDEASQHKEEALRLLDQGFSAREVCDMLGIHKTTM